MKTLYTAAFSAGLIALSVISFSGYLEAQAPPTPPPAPQAGHPSGKLVIWGDTAIFINPTDPNNCILTNRFKRGERVGFRMTAIDGGTGEVEQTAGLVAHVTFAGKTVDVPMRWRGGGQPYPQKVYLRAPNEMWTGGWEVPADAPIGMISYTVTATDRFGRKSTYTPFAAIPSQLTIVQ